MNNPNNFTNEASPAAQSLGQYLAKARLTSGLSISDLAQRTSRPAAYLEALEADDFALFKTPVVLRGIVSQYVKAVGADQATAMNLLPSQFKPTSPLASVGIKEGQKPIKQTASMGRSGLPKLGLVLLSLIVLALLAYWIFGARLLKGRDDAQKLTPPNQVQVTTPPAQPAAAPVVPAAPAADTANTAPAATTASEQAAAPATSDAAATTVATTAATGDALNLKFRGPVWVEIKDAQGKILLTGLQQPDTEQNVQGEAPLRVKLGDGTKVDMSWKGQPYDLTPLLKGRNTVVRIENLQ